MPFGYESVQSGTVSRRCRAAASHSNFTAIGGWTTRHRRRRCRFSASDVDGERVIVVVVHEDFDRCYRAVQSKDARFDGWFVTAVLTTKIYCRPSCPVRPPFARNVRFYPTAAAAQRAGFRACKRCRPDASPGSPEWNMRGDVVARAMRLIADGTVDREGVTGLAAQRGLHHPPARTDAAGRGRREPTGAGSCPADTDRASAHRDDRPAFQRRGVRGGILQHPTVQRHGARSVRPHPDRVAPAGADQVRPQRSRRPRARCRCGCRSRTPFAYEGLFGHLAASRSARRARRCATARTDGHCDCRRATESSVSHRNPTMYGARWCWTTSAISPLRSPGAVACWTSTPTRKRSSTRLAPIRDLSALVAKAPGQRIPRTVDEAELALRVVLGQQVSVKAARTHASRIVSAYGTASDRHRRRADACLSRHRAPCRDRPGSSWRSQSLDSAP